MTRQHEALAMIVNEGCAFAAQRFGRKRRRIAADHDRGRVELHEFGIRDDGAGACGDRKAKAARFLRIGGHGIEMPDAAGREHDGARCDDEGPRRRIVCLAQLQPRDRVVFRQQRFGDKAFDHADRGRLAYSLGQRGDDSLARHVAAHMHDALRRMRGLPADRKLALEIAIEGHAVPEQVLDACARPRVQDPARSPHRQFLRRPRSCPPHALPRCRPRRRRQRCRPAPRRLKRLRQAAPPKSAVTGRGASFNAQNRPARPPPTMTTSSVLRVRSWMLLVMAILAPADSSSSG